ncbi:CubicO group peptidase (beta-lactamase class C family) [Nocardioides albertanoniae]|uniref:CubicO group peptidase (Beta-lactamase class C family) n=1 Tax=Nocardioides albertanoniae TaxID=1175486 RepID=A0A543A552_9ACTN|nr:serine hydrolase domain-containing protein [Nocardioides albertanoniae]TQL67715.1 CubicO group peptidase (beta-lactamase class C family) [Nocardioides albertanoniae]
MSLNTAAVDELFAQRFAENLTPGLVYGVVRGTELIHSGAFGSTTLGGPAPGVDSVFRIASMSKSFTAAAVLLLRDRGLLDLDEAIAQYVPELVDQPPYSPDSPAVTLRLLLSMSAGLPTDDPWGDRQESLSYDDFGTFLDGGLTVGREPGVGFEYSNLGYALLGRAIENVVGGSSPEGANRDFIEHELLAPLGMTASAFSPDLIVNRVPGHVPPLHPAWAGDRLEGSRSWTEAEPIPSGSFAAMGGMHSSVADLARWVGGFVGAFSSATDAHPLSKASRREMQQMQRFGSVSATLALEGPEAGLGAVATGYGYGLMVDHDRLGQFVHHSGGYPGYGSRMLWHPATGLGVITLSNSTYAGAAPTAANALRRLVAEETAAGGPHRFSTVVKGLRPRLDSALEAAIERLRTFDPEGGEVFATPSLFADNVELDAPDVHRRTQISQARAKVGLPLGGAPYGYFSRSMGVALAVVPAEKGRYDLEVMLSPEAEPRIQTLRVSAVPDADEGMVACARAALEDDSPVIAALRAFGEPELITTPLSCDGSSKADFLVVAGATYWKVAVASSAVVTALPSADHPRLTYLASALRGG